MAHSAVVVLGREYVPAKVSLKAIGVMATLSTFTQLVEHATQRLRALNERTQDDGHQRA